MFSIIVSTLMTISLFGANQFFLRLVWLMKTEGIVRIEEIILNFSCLVQFLLEYRMGGKKKFVYKLVEALTKITLH